MKILNISNMPLWLWGEGKGIPSTFYTQQGFARAGHEVHFLCPQREGEPIEEEREGIRIHRFDFPGNFRHSRYPQTRFWWQRLRASFHHQLNWLSFQFAAYSAGRKILGEVNPDLIYAHTPQSAYVAWWLNRRQRTRFVLRLYGTHYLYRRRKSIFYRLKDCRDYLIFKLPADLFIITEDGCEGDLLAQEMGVPADRVRLWRNGIEPEFFKTDPSAKAALCEDLKIAPTSRIIVSTCRLRPNYNVDRFLAACREILPKNPDVVVVLAGSGPQQEALENYVKENRLSAQVFFLGILEREKVRQILDAADIFVFLPRFQSGTNVMWEAMAKGACIVTTDNEKMKKILVDGRDCIYISCEDVGARQLPAVLKILLADEKKRRSLGQGAREQARQHLVSWEERVAKEVQALEALCR